MVSKIIQNEYVPTYKKRMLNILQDTARFAYNNHVR